MGEHSRASELIDGIAEAGCGTDVNLVGSGPSLDAEPPPEAGGGITIAINHSIRVVPRADVWMALEDKRRYSGLEQFTSSPDIAKVIDSRKAGEWRADGTTYAAEVHGIADPGTYLLGDDLPRRVDRPESSWVYADSFLAAFKLSLLIAKAGTVRLYGVDMDAQDGAVYSSAVDGANPGHREPNEIKRRNKKYKAILGFLEDVEPEIKSWGTTVLCCSPKSAIISRGLFH